MSLSTGRVLWDKPYAGSTTPTKLTDRSRFGNDGVWTDVTAKQLPSGLWVNTFNGSTSQIVCGTLGIDYDATSWAISTWANLIGDQGETRGILHNRAGAGAASWWTFGVNTSNTLAIERTGGVTTTDPFEPFEQGWQMYTVRVVNGTDIKVFRNGVLTAIDFTSAEDIGDNTNDIRIGMWSGGNAWKGDIGLTRGYNRAPSDGEILTIYNQEKHWFGV